jgi:hypothetical protein
VKPMTDDTPFTLSYDAGTVDVFLETVREDLK